MSLWRSERGPTGDHGQAGQDGRDGRQGETGERGPAGPVSSGKQGERGQRGRTGGSTPGLRLRMLVLYVVMILVLALMTTYGVSTRRAFRSECLNTQSNTQTINTFLDSLIRSYRTSRILTPTEKAQRIEALAPLRQTVPHCPPPGWKLLGRP